MAVARKVIYVNKLNCVMYRLNKILKVYQLLVEYVLCCSN